MSERMEVSAPIAGDLTPIQRAGND